jgi:hypothetical protein
MNLNPKQTHMEKGMVYTSNTKGILNFMISFALLVFITFSRKHCLASAPGFRLLSIAKSNHRRPIAEYEEEDFPS